ncbi:MAG TPA: hypothetical protein G4N99_07940 [Thermoflexia bacterium]|nr:hypothetical protein [Thermoflexia bacterium]
MRCLSRVKGDFQARLLGGSGGDAAPLPDHFGKGAHHAPVKHMMRNR